MTYTRRKIIKSGAIAIASAASARPTMASSNVRKEYGYFSRHESRVRQLISTAVDAATAAGASYADARLTFTQNLSCSGDNGSVPDYIAEEMGFGVRALVDGYWGFASSPVWNEAEAGRLGRAAVSQARANSLGNKREVSFAPIINIVSGDWVMPIKDDPFEIAYEEIVDHRDGLEAFVRRQATLAKLSISSVVIHYYFFRQDKSFGSSLNQFTTQRLYRTEGILRYVLEDKGRGRSSFVQLDHDYLTAAGMGFEYIRDQPLRKYIIEANRNAQEDMKLPIIPIDVGRYSVLLDSQGVASALKGGVGLATELDRALGYEANTGGTSYIVDPLEMMGNLQIGNSLMNVTGNRSEMGSVGRVRWDDDGVEPSAFELVKEGVLVNMQTSREAAGWIKPHYTTSSQPFASSGCAYAPDAQNFPLIVPADLVLHPSVNALDTLDSLRTGMENGVEVRWADFAMDFQQVTGLGKGVIVYEIKKGKRTGIIINAGMVFRTPELWSNLMALGGSASSRRFGFLHRKGEPMQYSYSGVTAPPAVIKEVTFIDVLRKG